MPDTKYGFVDMFKQSGFTVEHNGHEIRVLYPSTYLGWTNILVVVTIDDEMEEASGDDLTTYAYITYFVDDDDDQYPIIYLSIPHYIIGP